MGAGDLPVPTGASVQVCDESTLPCPDRVLPVSSASRGTWQTSPSTPNTVPILPIMTLKFHYWRFISGAYSFDFCSMQIASGRVILPCVAEDHFVCMNMHSPMMSEWELGPRYWSMLPFYSAGNESETQRRLNHWSVAQVGWEPGVLVSSHNAPLPGEYSTPTGF